MASPDPSASRPSTRGPSVSLTALTPPQVASLRERWQQQGKWSIEQILDGEPEWHSKPEVLLDLVCLETELRRSAGDVPTVAEYLSRFPTLKDEIRGIFALDDVAAPSKLISEAATAETQDFGGNS